MQTEENYDIVFDAQQHFRLLLDSMSRPGKINTFPQLDILPPDGLNQAAALTGFALLNPDVTYYIAGDNSEDIASYFLVNTASRHAAIVVADYVFLTAAFATEGLEGARTGTAIYPEDSATFIACAEKITAQAHEGSLTITLKGPGVNGKAEVFVSGITSELLEFVKVRNSEYPLGIDLIVTDRHSNMVCIPRSNKFTYTEAGSINY